MLAKVASFEFRYQFNSALFRAAAAIMFLISFVDMSLVKLGTVGGGNILFNAPHAIIITHAIFSLAFLFLGAAFVSNVINRDDQTGFGAIVRSTRITKSDYLFGRFIGSVAVGALALAAVPLGAWLGTLMPFANQDMLGPNHLSGYLYGYGLIALPNALIISAMLFALATTTRSTAGTFVAVIVVFITYLMSQRLMEGQVQQLNVRVLADPLGLSAYMAASRYLTAAELNGGAVPVTTLMIESRLLWIAAALALLALTYLRFRLAEPTVSRRKQPKLARQAALEAAPPAPAQPTGRLSGPSFGGTTAVAQFMARAAIEARFIFKSPLFLILLVIASLLTFANLAGATGWMDIPIYPTTATAVPIVGESFRILLTLIAAFYGGELVWRERERKINEIIDATPLPAWALMLPKMIGLTLVLVSTLLVGALVGLGIQLLDGSVAVSLRDFALWYIAPAAVDAWLTAVLAVFIQALSPSKYAGWGIMFVYMVLLVFGPSLGLQYPLFIYGSVPDVPLSDMAGAGNFLPAAWWVRLFWAAVAAFLLVAVQLLWPRGADDRIRQRLRGARSRLSPGALGLAAAAACAVLLTGSWIVYNSRVLNRFESASDGQRYLAEYEKRYFAYARLPQPSVAKVILNVALYPAEMRAEVRGRYDLVNDTRAPIDRVHVRLMNQDLQLLALDFPGARLERDDARFGYRIYRLAQPMKVGEVRTLSFRTRRQQSGFRVADAESSIVPDGTAIDTLALTPRIGMSDVGLLEDAAARRKYGLPAQRPFPKLEDTAATMLVPSGGDAGWTTADIRVSTSADETPVAPGRRIFDHVQGDRHIARFVSDGPTKNLLSLNSARYAVERQTRGGIDYAIYYDPAHRWNVGRMMTAMQASIEHYTRAFGPYQFSRAQIVETPYGQGGHAYPGTLAVGESIFALDLRDPSQLDMVTMLTAHELSHQWWGHQVLGARMQGGSLLYETLAQYSALMVLRKLRGETDTRRFLRFQLDRYLSGRRTQVLEEQPLARVEISQSHIAYGKGALALYLLQERIGEDAVNRALRRFVSRYRFSRAPYPRSTDLIRMLREEARRPEDQALVTDLFERITLYQLTAGQPTAVRRADGRWDVSVPVEARKFYASGKGAQQESPLNELIPVGLFAADPRRPDFSRKDVVGIGWLKVRSGKQNFRFVSARKPSFAGIDPYNLYIDRNASDNVAPFMN